MKKQITLAIIALLTLVQVSAQGVLNLDTNKSTLKWVSEYTFYYGGHHGTVKFEKGSLSTMGGKIFGGHFTIDMNTIANVDGGYNKGLVAHLKDPDFFDVAKFPKAQLEITEVKYEKSNRVTIHANLTIKGITEPVKFIGDIDSDSKTLKTRFKIDRTRWGVTYNSKLKDNAISDAIGFEAELVFE